MSLKNLSLVTLVVRDYDEAINFYTKVLSFKVVEDTAQTEEKRWVVIAPANGKGCNLLLAKAVNDHQQSRIGDQTGGRVFLFLYTDDFIADHQQLVSNDVTIVRGPFNEKYGIVLVFKDLYGNLIDLIQPHSTET